MKITILGCGSSGGVPLVGPKWGACDPHNPKNRRLRPSILVQQCEFSIVIDTGPDFHQQALTNNIHKIDAVLYTHTHADHVHGIDELRGFNFLMGTPIPIYASHASLQHIHRSFDYIFKPTDGDYDNKPNLVPHEIKGDFTLSGINITPIEVIHGQMPTLGFRLDKIAYISDVFEIPEAGMEKLQNLDVLICYNSVTKINLFFMGIFLK